MLKFACMFCRSWQRWFGIGGVWLAGVFLFSASWPAHAIPSPELVIGSVSSISQLVAMLTALVGGGAVVAGARSGLGRDRSGPVNRWVIWLASASVLLLIGSVGFNVFQFLDSRDEARSRLEKTLVRPARNPGTRILDPRLKETSLAAQTKHKLGLSTDDAARIMADGLKGPGGEYILLDVRESAEHEMGTLPGATHVRFPDLMASPIDLKNKTAILFCHNGNRSSESCEKLARMGIDCRFVVGGIEKWIVEGRPFTDKNVRTLSDLRAVPPYPMQAVLLDTADVKSLVETEQALFVDVRYPGAFAIQHLPGAINVPVRPTPTAKLKQLIASLPKRPIIAACYDRRGCFASEVLGFELTRAGHDFRGRYTLPWEYFIPSPVKPHITAWLADSDVSLWRRAISTVALAIGVVSEYIGFVAAVILLALASRLIVLPVSLKAERDQIRSNAMTGEMADLKRRLKSDPRRLHRAIQALYRRHGLTPLRNLLALAFLPIMAIALSAVQLASTSHAGRLLWINDLSVPDPLYLLPAVIALLGCMYFHVAVAKNSRQRLYVWLIGFPVLAGMVMMLGSGANFYLIAALVLLLVQRGVVTGRIRQFVRGFSGLSQVGRYFHARPGIVPLANVEQLSGCGNKSYRLAQLRAHGVAVPDGLVLTGGYLGELAGCSPRARQRQLDRIWHRLGGRNLAVRSSAAAEDGDMQSFAGVYDSELNVGRSQLGASIDRVMASFSSARAGSYGGDSGGANILLQTMVRADYAGVLFTQDPEAAGMMMLEMVEGTADGLVSGLVAPQTYRFGRYSKRRLGDATPPIDVSALLRIGDQAEAMFAAPQDIEWTYENGRFLIVQSRDITTLGHGDGEDRAIELEWTNILSRAKSADRDEPVFEQTEMSEVLPRPTPLSLSLMQSLWAPGGSVDLACRDLGLTYPIEEDAVPHLTTLFGRLYVDRRQERQNAVGISGRAARRLTLQAERIAEQYKSEILPRFDAEMRIWEVAKFDRLAVPALLDCIEKLRIDFVTGTHVDVEVINICASFVIDQARGKLSAAGYDPAHLLAGVPDAGPAQVLSQARRAPPVERRDILLEGLGHRAGFDYELSAPRYSEVPEDLDILVSHQPSKPTPKNGVAHPVGVPGLSADLDQAAALACRYQALKEEAKHQSLRQIAVIRQAILALDRKVNFSGLCFYLGFDELPELAGGQAHALRQLAQVRRLKSKAFSKLTPLPASLTLAMLERASLGSEIGTGSLNGALKGTRVAGSGVAEGRAQVIARLDAEAGHPIEGFENGDILVCPMVHPQWLSTVLRSGGVICEVGGWLSHIAIVAREHDIPLIVGAGGLDAIQTGDIVRLLPSGEVERCVVEDAPSGIVMTDPEETVSLSGH